MSQPTIRYYVVNGDGMRRSNSNPLSPRNTESSTGDAGPSDITAALSDLDLGPASSEPTEDHCIAHLKLLEAFHQLREDVATSDGLFGLQDCFVPNYLSQEDQAIVLLKIREKRWAVYVAKAVDRFEKWWDNVIQPGSKMLRQVDTEDGSWQRDDEAQEGKVILFTPDNLPPIDVLMVWHAYMLNPRAFLEDCIRNGKVEFWRTGFPWVAIDSCIDNVTLEYSGTKKAKRYFKDELGYSWNNLNDSLSATIPCPNCDRIQTCPWTTCDASFFSERSDANAGRGFADKEFELRCYHCKVTISHERLRMRKFRKDIQDLMLGNVTMPGTILAINGVSSLIAETKQSEFGSKTDPIKDELAVEEKSVFFPNRVIQSGLITNLLSCTDVRKYKTLIDLRAEFEEALRKKDLVGRTSTTGILNQSEKIAVRRMLSRYWDNSSPFALDLVGAVIRQGSFIEKMHSIDWLHSPAVSATMTRLIVKYGRYFEILAKFPGKVAVPTLDIDLAWHTHQLFPKSYYLHSLRKTKVFIDHDDKVDENKLSDAFEWPSKTYQKMFSSAYSECTCWYCEAMRESSSSFISRRSEQHKNAEFELDVLRESPANTSNPQTGPHISAHSAIRSDTGVTQGSIKAAQLERSYQKARKRALKKGQDPPERGGFMYATAYGHPLYMPYYAPYFSDPCVASDLYPGNPSCASFTPGAAGNCCQGACGGGVAAGACGSAGAGACMGGGAGSSSAACESGYEDRGGHRFFGFFGRGGGCGDDGGSGGSTCEGDS